MAELMLVANPHKRRAKKRRRSRARRRNNPHRRAHRRRYHARRNPVRRHRARRRHYARRSNPHRIRHYRRRHNPSFGLGSLKGMVVPVLKEGLVGAGGALALDAAWGYINPQLPASIQGSPYLQFAVKCLAAIGVGFVGGKVLKGKGRDLAVGGVTVAMHDLLKGTLQTAMPTVFGAGGSLALSGYGAYFSGSAPIVGTATFPRTYQASNPGFGAYLSGDNNSGSGVYVDDATGMDPWNSDS